MTKNRVKSNVLAVKGTGVGFEVIDEQQGLFSLAFFGYDSTKGESVVPYINQGIEHITKIGYGQIYVPPTSSNNYPVLIKRVQGRTLYEMWSTRFPMNDESRPYTGDRFQTGDIIHNIAPSEEGVMGWVCYTDSVDSVTGEWRAWGALKRFCSEAQIVNGLPDPQRERESQILFYDNKPFICKYNGTDGVWYWEEFVLGSEMVNLSSLVEELSNQIVLLKSGLDWKESVGTFADLATTYPNAEDGWTVNVKDTDITYRFDGSNWIPISANSIPLASATLDGKMSKELFTKLTDMEQGYTTIVMDGLEYPNKNQKRLEIENGSTTATTLGFNSSNNKLMIKPKYVAYCNISQGVTELQEFINDTNILEIRVLYGGANSNTYSLTIDSSKRSYLKINMMGYMKSQPIFNITVTGTATLVLDIETDPTNMSYPRFNLSSGTLVIGRADRVAFYNNTTNKITIKDARSSYLSGPCSVTFALNSTISIGADVNMSFTRLVGCSISATLGTGTIYRIYGCGNKITTVNVSTGGYIVCPLDTEVTDPSKVSGGYVRFDLDQSGQNCQAMAKIDLGSISLGFVTALPSFLAFINPSTDGSVKDAQGNAWTVAYNEDPDTALDSSQVISLTPDTIGRVYINDKKIFVARPSPSIWTGPVAALPTDENKDGNTLYFAY